MAEEIISLNQLPTDFLRTKTISILEELDFQIETLKLKVLKIKSSSWTASVFKVMAGDSTKIINLYIKSLPINSQKRQKQYCSTFFKNEVLFYTIIVPGFSTFLREHFPRFQHSFLPVPKCYSAESDGENDVVIMEDLTSRGFTIPDRLKVLGIPELYLVMEHLGRFHGVSLAMKIIDPENFQKIREPLTESAFIKSTLDEWGDVLEFSFDDVLNEVQKQFPEDSDYVLKWKRFRNGLLDRMTALCHSYPEDEPYNVITHGDMWTCNFMYHYPSLPANHGPDEMRFIDFQQMRYTSLAMDVGRIFFICMDKQTRDAHREGLLRCYHSSVCNTLNQFGCMPEGFFPFEVLEVLLKKCAAYSVGVTMLTLSHALNECEGSEEDIKIEGDESLVSILMTIFTRKSEECRRRILEVIQEAVDRGYMDDCAE
ncbi:hypothetical protein ANN_04943 [Periplaneta americana]|uniref:CHK kinase-like domain-containing protein n=1 Tax=Periplaneta americana TaxID=6978 RepID=A0ABQ8T9R9_PERAM|nr:hypothetical protein ANN_04943 [Periplaneta americana]